MSCKGNEMFKEKEKENYKETKPVIAAKITNWPKRLSNLDVKLLILEVQKRSPLWDFSLPLEQRCRDIVRRLWDEVSMKLNGKLSGTDCKIKFKSLRDTHRKIIQKELQASGSARNKMKEKWKYYDVMEFLRDSCLIPIHSNVDQCVLNIGQACDDRRQTSSITDANDNDEFNNIDRDDCKNYSPALVTVEKCRRSHKSMEDEPQIELPPSHPPRDEVDSMLHVASLQLRRMPYRARMQTLLDVVQLVNNRYLKENLDM